MNPLGSRAWVLACAAAVWMGVGACSPTYRPEQMAEAIQQLSHREYHLRVSARQIGQTVAIHLHHPGLLFQAGHQIRLSPSANETLGNLIEVIHRVVLSSSAPARFYLLAVSDPTVPGAYLTLVRYVDDVRRVNANVIPPTELFSRTLLDLRYVGASGLAIEPLILQDIQLEQFLSLQLARRIQARLEETLPILGMSTETVGPCLGEYRGSEFTFTLNVTPQLSPPVEEDLIGHVFQEATEVIAQVLSDYRFEQFEAIRLIHPPTGRTLLLPKANLKLFH